jgi:hypothetical protein
MDGSKHENDNVEENGGGGMMLIDVADK